MTDDFDHIGDAETDPSVEPKSSRAWLAAITAAEKAFSDYQTRADNIDKLYASLRHLANGARDREFQLFWANVQVLGPSVYARPPVPVVVPKFKDRRPLYQTASELLERCSVVTFDMVDINSVMLLLRDDLNIQARGVAWLRYETKADGEYNTERVCIEHKDRKDFLHEPSRNWPEVGWVAGRSWLTKKEMRKRFGKTSGGAYKDADYVIRSEDKDNGGADETLQAGVWEIWSKTQNKVVWVAEGCDKLLDEGPPHLKLEGFFPCPKPAYATVQRRSLIPVPDMVYYKDQIEEINELTGRIHALSTAIQVRGFYPAGAGEIGDAIEAALKSTDNRQVMVPISNWAAFGNGGAKDTIVWLPIDMITTTIVQLVELRRQVIDDVYQIMGLSDIMRGSTDAQETLGAQQIKAQFGSVRIRDKQHELVRIARDIVRIAAEIMAEHFDSKTLLDMSQMEIPTDAEIKRQVEQVTDQAQQQLEQMVQQAMQAPEAQQMAQQNPEQAQQLLQQAEQQVMAQVAPQIAKLEQTPTVEKVMKFLKDQKIRPFVLDIETDSTIQPDEDAEKQRRSEFLQALGGTLQQLSGMVQAQPQSAPFAAEIIKFAVAPYRAGRSLDTAIEEFAEQMQQVAKQPQPNPEAIKAEAEAKAEEKRLAIEEQKSKTEAETRAVENQAKQVENAERAQQLEIKAMEAEDVARARQQELSAKATLNATNLAAAEEARVNAGQLHAQAMEKGGLEIVLLNKKIEQSEVQTANSLATTQAGVEATQQKAAAQPSNGA